MKRLTTLLTAILLSFVLSSVVMAQSIEFSPLNTLPSPSFQFIEEETRWDSTQSGWETDTTAFWQDVFDSFATEKAPVSGEANYWYPDLSCVVTLYSDNTWDVTYCEN